MAGTESQSEEIVSVEPTLINDEAKFLDSGQISTDSVDPVSLQTWKQLMKIYMKQNKDWLQFRAGVRKKQLEKCRNHQLSCDVFKTERTSLIYGFQTELNEPWNRGSFTFTESQKMAAKNSICGMIMLIN